MFIDLQDDSRQGSPTTQEAYHGRGAVRIILVDQKGRILTNYDVGRHRTCCERGLPCYVSVPGGIIGDQENRFDESEEDAARRELFEEGIRENANTLEFVGSHETARATCTDGSWTIRLYNAARIWVQVYYESCERGDERLFPQNRTEYEYERFTETDGVWTHTLQEYRPKRFHDKRDNWEFPIYLYVGLVPDLEKLTILPEGLVDGELTSIGSLAELVGSKKLLPLHRQLLEIAFETLRV